MPVKNIDLTAMHSIIKAKPWRNITIPELLSPTTNRSDWTRLSFLSQGPGYDWSSRMTGDNDDYNDDDELLQDPPIFLHILSQH